MAANLNQIPRPEKRDIAHALHHNLAARAAAFPPEPALDAFIPELDALVKALDASVAGNTAAAAERLARLADLDTADDEVDTWYRHIESFVSIEANRRTGPNVQGAANLHHAAFPDGLAHVNDPVADENRICRTALDILRSAEFAPVVAAILLPTGWLDRWEKALDGSDMLNAEIEKARAARKTHISTGQDAEADFVELMPRLRRYVASRAKASDTARIAEGKELLAPLLDAMARLKATAALRATKRTQEKAKTQEANEDASG